MSRQTSIQLTEATEAQVDTLKNLGFGTFTDIVRAAVDRMARQESEYAARRSSRIADAVLALRDELDEEWGGSVVITDDEEIRIDTRASRDPWRSSNGGDYYEWLSIWCGDTGTVYAENCTSCELARRDEPEAIGSDWNAVVEQVMALAEKYGVPVNDHNKAETGWREEYDEWRDGEPDATTQH